MPTLSTILHYLRNGFIRPSFSFVNIFLDYSKLHFYFDNSNKCIVCLIFTQCFLIIVGSFVDASQIQQIWWLAKIWGNRYYGEQRK